MALALMPRLLVAVALIALWRDSVEAAEPPTLAHLSIHGREILAPDGQPIRLRGFNILWWEPPTAADATTIRQLGANCVRYMFGYTPKGHYDPTQLAAFEHDVRLFTACGLWVIPVVHTFERKDGDALRQPWNSPEIHQEFLAMWSDLITRLRDEPLIAAWEPINEPHDASETVVAAWYHEVVPKLRKLDPLRPLVVEGANYSNPKDLGDYLVLDDPGLIYSFHFYVPYQFTHEDGQPPAVYPGVWSKDFLRAEMAKAKAFQDKHGVPVWCGEWGARTKSSGFDRWLRDTCELLEENHFHWTHWAWMAKPGAQAADDGSFDVNRKKPGIYGVMSTIFDDLDLKPPHGSTALAATTAQSWVGVPVDATTLLNQHLHTASDNACVPTTLLNALRCGPPAYRRAFASLEGATDQDKLERLIVTCGALPSRVEAGETVYNEKRGVEADDLPLFLNALLKGQALEPLTGTYFERKDGETTVAHLARVHALLRDSLVNGVPVVTSLRAFAATKEEGKDFLWNGIGAHGVLIVAVPETLDAGQRGFAFRYVDPWFGALSEGYIRIEEIRGFKAVKGSGQKDFTWLDNGFLQVDAPRLNLGTARLPWFSRSFITLNYGVGRFSAAIAP